MYSQRGVVLNHGLISVTLINNILRVRTIRDPFRRVKFYGGSTVDENLTANLGRAFMLRSRSYTPTGNKRGSTFMLVKFLAR